MWQTHSSITNKQAVLKWERKQPLSCIKVWFSSPESMMENLPFSCGWGWDISFSLEKEFEGAAGAVQQWISFELWNSLSQTSRWAVVESFFFKYCSMASALYEFKGFQPVSISISFCDLGVELYTQDLVKFLQCCLFQDIFFKMAGSGLATASKDVRSFTVLLSRSKDYYVYSQWQS